MTAQCSCLLQQRRTGSVLNEYRTALTVADGYESVMKSMPGIRSHKRWLCSQQIALSVYHSVGLHPQHPPQISLFSAIYGYACIVFGTRSACSLKSLLCTFEAKASLYMIFSVQFCTARLPDCFILYLTHFRSVVKPDDHTVLSVLQPTLF